jgi:plastocyanin
MKFLSSIAVMGGMAAIALATDSCPAPSSSTPPPPTQTGDIPAIQTVIVGGGADLRYKPPFINVKQGSIVHFDFLGKNHTLTESSFENPCKKLQGTDVDTDFNNFNPDDIPNLHPFDFTFANDKPRYFYCKQGNGTPNGHCGKGMVFAVNVDAKRFQEFQWNAMATLPKIKGRSPVEDEE